MSFVQLGLTDVDTGTGRTGTSPAWPVQYEPRDYFTPPSRSMVVTVSVCLRSHLRNCKSDLRQIFMHVTNDRGSVLLWWRCDALYFSGFMYDAVFVHNGQ